MPSDSIFPALFTAFLEHAFAEEAVDFGLVAAALGFEPGENVRVEADGYGLFDGAIPLAAHGVLPCAGREFGNVGGVDLLFRQCGELLEFALLARRQRLGGS